MASRACAPLRRDRPLRRSRIPPRARERVKRGATRDLLCSTGANRPRMRRRRAPPASLARPEKPVQRPATTRGPSGRRRRSAPLLGFEDGQQYDRHQNHDRKLVEPAQPDMAAGIAPKAEVEQQLAAPEVISNQQCDQRELGVQPAARALKPAKPEPQPERQCQHAARRGDAPEELALHHLEALERNRVARLRVVNEKARQVEEARKPRHHEDEVQRLDEQHGYARCQLLLTMARRMARRRWKKWSAPGTTTTGRSCGRAQASTSASGTVLSSSPWITIVSAGTGGASKCFTATPTSAMRSGL